MVSSHSRVAFVVTIVFDALAAVAVVVRFLTRTVIKAKFGLDDWFIVLALLCLWVVAAMNIWGIVVGGGAQDLNHDPIERYAQLQLFLKAMLIAGPFYDGVLTFARLSITALYRRIFALANFRRVTFGVDAVTIAWGIVAACVNVFGCTPVDHLWKPESKGSCISGFETFLLVSEIFGIILDVFILSMPIRMIMRLQMSMRTKQLLCGVFLVGGFVVITNIIRLTLVYSSSGTYVNFNQSTVWSILHASTAVICACLPTYKALFPKIASFSQPIRKKYDHVIGRYSTTKSGSRDSTTLRSPYIEMKGNEGPNSATKAKSAYEISKQTAIDSFSLDRTDSRKTTEFV